MYFYRLNSQINNGGTTSNIFNIIKDNLTTRQVAEAYGLEVTRNGMTRCLFHDDRNPSMKVDKRYYCFGCQASGDVINFATRLFGLRPIDSAKRLAADFGIPVDEISRKSPPDAFPKVRKPSYNPRETTVFFGILTDYLAMLEEWLVRYAPSSPDEKMHPRFHAALCEIEQIRHYQDGLLTGSKEEQIEITDILREIIPAFQASLYEYGIEKCKEEKDYDGK